MGALKNEIYKCEACGNVVMVLEGGDGDLVCCGEPMKGMTENTADAAKEKHLPVIKAVDGGVKVKKSDSKSGSLKSDELHPARLLVSEICK